MIFTVVWSAPAQDQLARVWLAALDRTGVTRAAHRVDRLLRVDPHLQGFPLGGGDRIVSVPPLRVVVAVNWMDMIAEVVEVLGP